MDCTESRALLHGYLDGELGREESARLEGHLRKCALCAQELRQQTLLRAALREHASALPDLSGLRARIEASLPARQARWHLPASIAPRFALAAVLTAAVVLTWAITFFLTREPNNERLMDVAVSAHMRSFTGNHLTDVASPDPQRVADWFRDRLPFAPPVRDLSGQGYQLVGGRLDYVYKWQVGALVYRRGETVISVFIWPASPDDDFPRRILSDEGLNMVFWTQAGMNFCSISVLQADDLARFMRAYAS
jgi:anti-sigma factor RsiW